MRLLLAILAAVLLLPALARAAEPPQVTSKAALLMEVSTGDVAYEKDPDTQLAIASTTKLMTALVALESGGLDETITAPRYRALPVESIMGLTRGEQITEADLLRGLLMVSANDAAAALAAHEAGTVPSFVRRMNRRAIELGLENTSYANPIGLDDPGNYSTARDLATLTRQLRTFKFFRETVDAERLTLESGTPRAPLTNRNELVFREPWVDGVKTGNTSLAGNVLVASGKRRGVPLIAVVIGASAEDVAADEALALLNYGFTVYERKSLVQRGARLPETVPIEFRPGATLPVVAGRSIRKVLRTGQEFELEPVLPAEVRGPVDEGDQVGVLKATVDGQPAGEVPLLAALDVPEAGFGRETQDFLTRPSTLAILGGVLLVAALLLSRRPARKETPA